MFAVEKNGSMKLIAKAPQAGFVWLTAVTTLIASVPHFHCICPNGQRKPFCFGLASSSTGCCCGGSCCSSSSGGMCCAQVQDSSADEQAEAPCCHKNRQQPSTVSPGSDSQLQGSCCNKTWTTGEYAIPGPTKATAEEPSSQGFSVTPFQVAHASPDLICGGLRISWAHHHLPPPINLIIALQHFAI